MPDEEPAELQVEVVYSPRADCVERVELKLAAGSTVAAALQASGLLQRHPSIEAAAAPMVGVWGREAALDRALRDGDRVEVYRPLVVDPKEARRRRHREQRKAAKPNPSGSRSP